MTSPLSEAPSELIPVSEPQLAGNEADYLLDAVRSTWISSSGKYLDRFEAMFAEYVGARHALAVSNGTAALHLALSALKLSPGDEVIVPNLTFIASANVVVHAGLVPVLADSEPDTWNLSVSSVARLISNRTRAIMLVHLYGNPCAMDGLLTLAKESGLIVIEDAAEAVGTRYRGRHVGALGRVGTFSFYGNKTITTGEGGMIVTDDAALAARMKLLKNHGMSPTAKYWFDEIGFNYRMTNLQAAVGCAQLERVDSLVEAKKRNAALYHQLLSPRFVRPRAEAHGTHSYWMFCVVLPDGVSREAFAAGLRARGIDSRPLFHPLSTMPPYRNHRHELSEETRRIALQGINLPSSARLTEEQIARICAAANTLLAT